MWLPLALLLFGLPGCLSLRGPRFVTGIAGSSLTIRCWYEQSYKDHNKYWCRGQHDIDCDKIVETKGEEREERNGRVSIRDNADALVLTVTVRDLHAADAGSYWCKIQTTWIFDAWSRDPSFQVQVSVSPAPTTTPRPSTFPATVARRNFSTNQLISPCPGVPLSIMLFLILVFLKVLLLLSMLGAVLCMSRRQAGPGGRRNIVK
ncbi:CMRF35-like molecule 2 [Pteronotus mesoamericanus]|uniref:CMRF35-like molecule 2 n=1 Tax=Pteronotus mesoamericanus TaxID=1884717 RepID=UPI0023EAC363|nr:CMRF35-like molecule 2 [Pteronotus parnellii mesoamericanus]